MLGNSRKRGGKRPRAGRRRLPPGESRLQIWARIRPDLHAKLLERAHEAKLSISRLIEQLLEAAL